MKCFVLRETTFFGQISEMGQILPKKVLLHKMSRMQLKLSFSGVLNLFHLKMTKKILFEV